MKNKRNVIISLLMTIISGVYIYLVKTIDVKAIGPENTSVGFSKMNGAFKNVIDSNMTIYKLTEIAGLFVLLIVGVYGLIGIYQLFKRRSLFKVDKEIISLGFLYILVIMVYGAFEVFIINYRPILIDGKLEASFPSSHTMLALCVCLSSLIVSSKYVPKKFFNITTFVTVFLLTIVFLGRLISGVHWLSDIIGGVIISVTLLSYFCTVLKWENKN